MVHIVVMHTISSIQENDVPTSSGDADSQQDLEQPWSKCRKYGVTEGMYIIIV